ncbi:PqiC family protein [Jannaschia formosa]|uniref:PqiC family protein n=1 Tax=Jannaschia formosa TaxID=2259592 RepID=UPI00143165C3|nr:PqiC family protein [Jannaschia formosa]
MRLTLPFVLALAACSQTQFYVPPPSSSELRLNVGPDTVMINEASIPEYAVNQEIPIQQPDGSLTTDTGQLWADLPDRALAGSLMRHLNLITDAEVAVEPWPLGGFPDAEVSIFVEDMIVLAAGSLRFTGSYAIRREEGRGEVETFSIQVPMTSFDYVTIIAAHEAAWLQLAEQIARAL